MNIKISKKNKVISNHLRQVDKQEKKLLNKKSNSFFKSRITPFTDKLQEKIPDKLKDTLELAFYTGFKLVFAKGNVYIEKTYNKDKLLLEHDLNNYAVDKYTSKKYMKRMDKQSQRSKTINSSIAILEGGVLGILGIGLPDIPLFISVILRTINEIALSYGYTYDTEEEKNYILSLICGALTKGERQKVFDAAVDRLGKQMNSDIVEEYDLEQNLKETANVLSDALLTAKFVQGLPIVGVIGGVVNHMVIHKIGKYATIKYKKRYLQHKLDKLGRKNT